MPIHSQLWPLPPASSGLPHLHHRELRVLLPSRGRALQTLISLHRARSPARKHRAPTAYPQPFHVIPLKLLSKAGLIERRVLILIKANAPGDLHCVVGKLKLRVKRRTIGILDAVGRPFAALPLKAHVLKGVPVSRCVDGDPLCPGRLPIGSEPFAGEKSTQ
jgi:hypothetical protein